MLNLSNLSSCGLLDYTALISALADYKAPHRKITTLIQSGEIIRLKKGLYLLGKQHYQGLMSRELLANLIYGPSYISQLYALQYYGLIPEKVETVTSMTSKRHKSFETPVGTFVYTYLQSKKFTVGVDWIMIRPDIHVLMASPEKALVDLLFHRRDITTKKQMIEHIVENLRIDEQDFFNLSLERLTKISEVYRKPAVSLLTKVLSEGY